MHFYCEKTTCGQKPELGGGGLNRPLWEAEDVKCMGVENLAGGLTPPTPPSAHALILTTDTIHLKLLCYCSV